MELGEIEGWTAQGGVVVVVQRTIFQYYCPLGILFEEKISEWNSQLRSTMREKFPGQSPLQEELMARHPLLSEEEEERRENSRKSPSAAKFSLPLENFDTLVAV